MINTLLQRAVALHNAGDTAQAMALYRRVLAFEPGNADAQHLLGLLVRREGRVEDGVAMLARALRLVPQLEPAILNHGLMLLQLGRLDAAAESFRRKLALEPVCVSSLYRLGTNALSLGRPGEAARLLRVALDLDTDRGPMLPLLRRGVERCATMREIAADSLDPSLPMGLVLRGVFRDSSGYALVVRRFARGLTEAGIPVRLVDLNYEDSDNLADGQFDPLLATLNRPVRAKAVLTISTPLAVERVPGLKSIVYTMFEACGIPPIWAAHSRRHDHVIVATDSSRQAWLRAEHPPDRIHITPAGVEALEPDRVRCADIVDQAGRRFTDFRVRVLNVSDLNTRKNLDGLLRVWLRATRAEDSAALLLKLGKGRGVFGDVRDLLTRVQNETGRTLTETAPIFLVEGKLSDAEMMTLHAASSHYWSMSHGEGWDLPMAQAGAMGLTLLAPDHSAYRAYLDGDVAHLIPSSVEPATGGYAGQDWWTPDEAAACRLLRGILDDPDGTRRSAQAHLRERMTWEAATRRLIALLRDLDAL